MGTTGIGDTKKLGHQGIRDASKWGYQEQQESRLESIEYKSLEGQASLGVEEERGGDNREQVGKCVVHK